MSFLFVNMFLNVVFVIVQTLVLSQCCASLNTCFDLSSFITIECTAIFKVRLLATYNE